MDVFRSEVGSSEWLDLRVPIAFRISCEIGTHTAGRIPEDMPAIRVKTSVHAVPVTPGLCPCAVRRFPPIRDCARRVLLAVILGLGLCLGAPAWAQVQITPTQWDTEEETPTFTVDETQEILIANGIPQEMAEKYLLRFDPERTFTQEEIALMVQLLRPEEAPLIPGQPAPSPTGAAQPPVKEIPVFPKEYLPPEYEERVLKPFGYDLFRTAVIPATPPEDISVGPDYIVGVGDEILVTIWGDVEKRFARVIDRQGRLVLPEVGAVTAAGKNLGELREELHALFGQVYRNLRMSVSLGDVRTIQVYVSGDVRKPGGYTLSALSTVFTTLYHAGGPTLKGSLRNISVSRNGEPPREIDLYQFLLTGQRGMDLPVQGGDVVHVHPLGPTITVRGEVRRPAIYEIREGETARDAVTMAGGLTPLAYTERITVDRYSKTSGTQTNRLDWSDPNQNLPLSGGDEVTVFSVYQVRPPEFVEIHGVVQQPGMYRLVPGMKVGDLVFRAGGALEGAFLERGEIARSVESTSDSLGETLLITFPLREILADPDHAENLVLQRGDKVFVRGAPGWDPPQVVDLQGEVQFPGKYGLRGRSERMSEVVARAGGLTPWAFPRGAKVIRKDEGRIIIDFSKALGNPRSSDNIVLADGDSLFVPRRPETVRVSGGVAIPGLLIYTPGKKANYYIERTGGFTEKANPRSVKIIRVTGDVETARRRFWSDPEIQEGDEIRVAIKEESKPIDWGKTLREAATIVASLATTVYVLSNISK